MKNFYVIFACLSFHFFTAQIITFQDQDFKMKLVNSGPNLPCAYDQNGSSIAVDANHDGEIQVSEVVDIYQLYLVDHNIENFTGLQYFTNLTTLETIGNYVGNLNLTAQPNLRYLYCHDSQLSSITFNPNANLRTLHCYNNNITQLNISGMTNLQNLACHNNLLTELDISGLEMLEIVDCSINLLTNLDVNGDISLQTLYCRQNNLTSLQVVGLNALTYIACDNNQITSLDISGHANLNYLTCSFNQLSTLIVSGCTSMTELLCNNNLLTNLDTSGLISLSRLYCFSNQLTSLNLSENINLLMLLCNSNSISALDFTGLPLLTNLLCSDNLLSTLDLSQQPIFFQLECNNNNLQTLYIKNNSQEGFLEFSGNPGLNLVCVDNEQLTEVEDIVAQYNYANCTVNTNCLLSTNEFDTESVTMYPNPASNELNIILKSQSKITIFNVLGQAILTFPNAIGKTSLDISKLNPGNYLMNISSQNENWNKKFIKL